MVNLLELFEGAVGTGDREPCKGLSYRGHSSVYETLGGGLALKKYVTPLKRLSCPGCENCGSLIDQIPEFLYDKGYDFGLSEIVDGEIYELRVTNIRVDWETGKTDSWDLKFIKQTSGE